MKKKLPRRNFKKQMLDLSVNSIVHRHGVASCGKMDICEDHANVLSHLSTTTSIYGPRILNSALSDEYQLQFCARNSLWDHHHHEATVIRQSRYLHQDGVRFDRTNGVDRENYNMGSDTHFPPFISAQDHALQARCTDRGYDTSRTGTLTGDKRHGEPCGPGEDEIFMGCVSRVITSGCVDKETPVAEICGPNESCETPNALVGKRGAEPSPLGILSDSFGTQQGDAESENLGEATPFDEKTEFRTDPCSGEKAPKAEAEPTPPFSPSNTLFIFDWDDTLCPSSWLNTQELTVDSTCSIPESVAARLAKLAELSATMLRTAASLGKVVIVTNAEEGWIQLSCSKFMPTLLQELSSYEYLSARSKFEKISNYQFAWKEMAFKETVVQHAQRIRRASSSLTSPTVLNVLSFGDSQHERCALLNVAKMQIVCPDSNSKLFDCRSKSIKLIERPHLDELIQELELICGVMSKLTEVNEDLDLCINSSHSTAAYHTHGTSRKM